MAHRLGEGQPTLVVCGGQRDCAGVGTSGLSGTRNHRSTDFDSECGRRSVGICSTGIGESVQLYTWSEGYRRACITNIQQTKLSTVAQVCKSDRQCCFIWSIELSRQCPRQRDRARSFADCEQAGCFRSSSSAASEHIISNTDGFADARCYVSELQVYVTFNGERCKYFCIGCNIITLPECGARAEEEGDGQ